LALPQNKSLVYEQCSQFGSQSCW